MYTPYGNSRENLDILDWEDKDSESIQRVKIGSFEAATTGSSM